MVSANARWVLLSSSWTVQADLPDRLDQLRAKLAAKEADVQSTENEYMTSILPAPEAAGEEVADAQQDIRSVLHPGDTAEDIHSVAPGEILVPDPIPQVAAVEVALAATSPHLPVTAVSASQQDQVSATTGKAAAITAVESTDEAIHIAPHTATALQKEMPAESAREVVPVSKVTGSAARAPDATSERPIMPTSTPQSQPVDNDLLPRMRTTFRLLDLYHEQGSGGLGEYLVDRSSIWSALMY